ncbi:MAG: hypothetical protein P8166_15755 [Candidatus Thiodiazotropha sp.]
MKFSDILASTIHDMKNSLSMVINTLDELSSENQGREDKRLSTLQHESKRLNNNLIARDRQPHPRQREGRRARVRLR